MTMQTSGWIVMVVMLGGIWGGFIYLLVKSVRQGQQ